MGSKMKIRVSIVVSSRNGCGVLSRCSTMSPVDIARGEPCPGGVVKRSPMGDDL